MHHPDRETPPSPPRTATTLAAVALVAAGALAGCGDSPPPTDVDPGDTLPTVDPVPVLTQLPERLSELRLDAAVGYEPAWPLWSNGLGKDRRILLPTGARVTPSTDGGWGFPEGTLLIKTFSMEGPGASARNVETRVLWRTGGDWTSGVYLWSEDQADATLRETPTRTPVSVTDAAGETFEHVVPSRADCVGCHGASPEFILGFDRLQLTGRDGSDAQLRELVEAGALATLPPGGGTRIEDSDAEKVWVMGYLTGNCVHCHNGTTRFDLSHEVFDAQVLGQRSPGGQVLIAPGDAEGSEIWVLLRDRVMPTLGVQRVDTAAVGRLGRWIESLDGSGG